MAARACRAISCRDNVRKTSGQQGQTKVTDETIETGAGAASRRPVRSHPVFPALVALWFAALLGIGSFVLPTALLESVVSAARLPDIMPAAAAPHGQTARIMLSLGAACVGGAFGMVLAMLMTRLGAGKTPSAGEAQYFISAHEELGEDGFDTLPGNAEPETEDAGFDDIKATEPESLADEPLAEPVLPETPVHAEQAPREAVIDARPRQPSAADMLMAKPLGEMGMVELVERFALSLQHHCPPQVSAHPTAPSGRVATEVFPANFMENDPPRPFERPRIVTNAEVAASVDDNPAETERALRDALEKLQRMSGAA